jgi:hypothetical protein
MKIIALPASCAAIYSAYQLHLSLYAQAGYQLAVAQTKDGTRNGVKGDVGLRYAWWGRFAAERWPGIFPCQLERSDF